MYRDMDTGDDFRDDGIRALHCKYVLYPAAIYSGAAIGWGDFVVINLIPATLGNIVGGMLLVGCIYYYLFLRNGNGKR